ncbi:MAG: hypothetical protein ACRELX_04575, partial [Longimicrobiales bacterium]
PGTTTSRHLSDANAPIIASNASGPAPRIRLPPTLRSASVFIAREGTELFTAECAEFAEETPNSSDSCVLYHCRLAIFFLLVNNKSVGKLSVLCVLTGESLLLFPSAIRCYATR